jgi:hypothetical protein
MSIEPKRGVVDLDVDGDFLLQPVALQECIDGRHVAIVLMLGRLEGLRLDENRALEAEAMLVFDHHGEKTPIVIEFAAQVGIQQRVVALATAPEHIVLAAEPVRGLEASAYLGGCEGKHFRVRAGGCTARVARVAEQVRGAPQQAHAAGGHLLGHRGLDGLEVSIVFGERLGARHGIDIVEREVGRTEPRQKIEGGFELGAGHLRRYNPAQPWSWQRTGAEDIRARPVEGMPVAHRAAQPLGHGLALHEALGIIGLEGEIVAAVRSFETDRCDVGEKAHGGDSWNSDFSC